jgi:hypothetical protein
MTTKKKHSALYVRITTKWGTDIEWLQEQSLRDSLEEKRHVFISDLVREAVRNYRLMRETRDRRRNDRASS